MSKINRLLHRVFKLNQRQAIRLFVLGITLVAIDCVGTFAFLHYHVSADFLTIDKKGGNVYVPTNLRSIGRFNATTKKSTTTLLWDGTPNAASYNIYDYDVKIANISSTTYVVPDNKLSGNTTYTVTGVDANGIESLPSNLTMLETDTDTPPTWQSNTLDNPPALPAPATFVTPYPEWNLGKPRNRIAWQVCQNANVYRDGVMVAEDMWNQYYIDSNVQPGSVHSYTVSCTISWWPGHREGPQGNPVTVTALTAQPQPLAQKVDVTRVVPNDDSVMVYFKPVPGAADYRVYSVSSPYNTKYMGFMPPWPSSYQDIKFLAAPHEKNFKPQALPAELSIEMNNISTTAGADLVVEAVDKPGPFQKQDGTLGVGSMAPDGTTTSQLNGQGDPSDVPNTIASSDVFHVTTHPSTALNSSGTQKFFDTFSDNSTNPFTLQPCSVVDPLIVKAETGCNTNFGGYANVDQYSDSRWNIVNHETDQLNSKIFVMSNHFMDTIYDGPTAEVMPFSHNNNASMVMQPKATADISGNKILHATMEVDAHFDGRRWVDIFIGQAGQSLTDPRPTKLGPTDEMTTPAGNLVSWEVNSGNEGLTLHEPSADPGGNRTDVDLIQAANYNDGQTVARNTNYSNDYFNTANGTPLDLDKRSRFDIYISQTHYKIVETSPDGIQLVREKDFPAGQSLNINDAQVYFTQELYHTGNDHPELNGTSDQYWLNYRPWGDERHWDNMGFEVLPANAWGTSAVVPQLQVSAPPQYLAQSSPTPPPTPSNNLVVKGALSNRPGEADNDVQVAIKTFGTTIATTTASMDSSGTITISNQNFLKAIPGNNGFSLVVWPKGYYVKTIGGQQVLSAIANGQTLALGTFQPGNFVGANDNANTATLGDLVALIRAYNGLGLDLVAGSFPSGSVTLRDIVSFINFYRSTNS